MYKHNQKEKDGDITIKTVVNILNIGKVFHISYLEEKKYLIHTLQLWTITKSSCVF